MEYTQEQKDDIQARFKLAADFLKENELNVAASVHKVNIGNDIFADKVEAFLVDTKYAPKESVPSPFNEVEDESKKS